MQNENESVNEVETVATAATSKDEFPPLDVIEAGGGTSGPIETEPDEDPDGYGHGLTDAEIEANDAAFVEAADAHDAADASLARIRAASDAIRAAREAYNDARAAAKAKKEAIADAVRQLQEVIEAETASPGPLFEQPEGEASSSDEAANLDAGDTDTTERADSPEPLPPPKREPQQWDGAADAPDAWRYVGTGKLGEVGPDSLSSAIIKRLHAAGLSTIGEIADYTAGGELLTDIPKIGEAKAGAIETALEAFWALRKKEAEARQTDETNKGKAAQASFLDAI